MKLWQKLAIVAVVSISVIWIFHTIYVWSLCGWYGHETGRETRYSMFLGCTVKIGDNYVPRTELRVVQ